MVGVVLNAVGPQHAYGAYYSSTYGYGYGYGHNVEPKIAHHPDSLPRGSRASAEGSETGRNAGSGDTVYLMLLFLVAYGEENNCNSGIAMFITRRLSTAASGKFSENATSKAFRFIDLGIS